MDGFDCPPPLVQAVIGLVLTVQFLAVAGLAWWCGGRQARPVRRGPWRRKGRRCRCRSTPTGGHANDRG